MDVLRFILRLPFILLRLAARSLVYLFTLLGFLLRPFTGQLLHLALVSEQTEAGGCCAAGGAGYFRVCAAPFGG